MRKVNNDRITSFTVIMLALIFIVVLAASGCTQGTTTKQLCSSVKAKTEITRLLLEDGMVVNTFYMGYMVDKAELGEYTYVAEGASICWVSLNATTTELTSYNRETYGYTYAAWEVLDSVRVRHIGIKYL